MIITKIYGTGITGVAVAENTYKEAMGSLVVTDITSYEYQSGTWYNADTSTAVDFDTLGITPEGTPVDGDTIVVAYHQSGMVVFNAGEGIPAPDLNANFDTLRTQSTANEAKITNIENTALRIDGSNVTDATVAAFNRNETVTLATSGASLLTDNAEHFLAPTGDCDLTVPVIAQGDLYSHTINIAIQGSNYGVTLYEGGTAITRHLLNGENVDTTLPYNILLMYNHLDGHWYYYISQ